ncbi:MAG TPA: hypothetical protein VHQ47_05365 [Phycisphaerae bacterium]|jgi:hypothetical protein|nr:hypothetical protein [Phycisphaerae bacterium]
MNIWKVFAAALFAALVAQTNPATNISPLERKVNQADLIVIVAPGKYEPTAPGEAGKRFASIAIEKVLLGPSDLKTVSVLIAPLPGASDIRFPETVLILESIDGSSAPGKGLTWNTNECSHRNFAIIRSYDLTLPRRKDFPQLSDQEFEYRRSLIESILPAVRQQIVKRLDSEITSMESQLKSARTNLATLSQDVDAKNLSPSTRSK